MKITKALLRTLIKEELQDAIGMERGEIVEVVIDRTSIEPGFAMGAGEGESKDIMVPLTELDLL